MTNEQIKIVKAEIKAEQEAKKSIEGLHFTNAELKKAITNNRIELHKIEMDFVKPNDEIKKIRKEYMQENIYSTLDQFKKYTHDKLETAPVEKYRFLCEQWYLLNELALAAGITKTTVKTGIGPSPLWLDGCSNALIDSENGN